MNSIKFANSVKSLALICGLFAFIFMSSCEEDTKSETTDELQLLSFGPSGVKSGDEISFIGNNLDRVTAIRMVGAEIPSSEFTEFTSSIIKCNVPSLAEEGIVTLIHADGELESLTVLSMDITETALISSASPVVRAGDNFVIAGEFLNWVDEVVFFNGLSVTEFESQSATELSVKVPLESQTGDVNVIFGGTDPLVLKIDNVVVKLPAAASFSPEAVIHTNVLTITGTELDLITEIAFPTAAGTEVVTQFESQSVTQLDVVVPSTAVDGALVFTAVSGLEVTTTQTISIVLPAATADATPSPAIIGENVTIAGTNFDLIESLNFPGVEVLVSNFVSKTNTEIVVAVPEGAVTGGIGYVTIHGVAGSLGAELDFGGDGPKPLAFVWYDEAIADSWGNWSAADKADFGSTENVLSGDVSARMEFGGWDAWGMGGGDPQVDVSTYTSFVIYMYGGPNTEGLEVQLVADSQWGSGEVLMTIVEGVWTEFEIPLSEINYDGTWERVDIQGRDLPAGSVVWIDYVGFR